jgi:hypothetical protein
MAAFRDTPRTHNSTHPGAVGGFVFAGSQAREGHSFTDRNARVPARQLSDHRATATSAARTTARRAFCTSSATELLVTERSA